MTSYARVTLADAQRNVELLLPSDVPVGELLPELLGSFRPRTGIEPSAVALTSDGGGSLPWGLSLDEAGVADGAVLRLTHRADQVPAPVVYDMVDEAVGSRPAPIAWPHGAARTAGAGIIAALLAVCATSLLTLPFTTASASILVGGAAILLFVLAAAMPPRWGLGLPLVGAGVALCLEGVLLGAGRGGIDWWMLAPLGSLAVLAWFSGQRQWRHLTLSAATMALLAAAWVGLLVLFGTGPAAGAVLAIITTCVLGALPRLALALSGIARLDDRTLAGDPVQRPRALAALDAAHQGLAVSVLLCSLSTWASVRLLLSSDAGGAWALVLAFLVVAVTGLRSRVYPLVLERVALQAGAVLAGVLLATRLLLLAPSLLWPLGIALLVLFALAVCSLVIRLPEHVGARLRVWGGRLEMIATVMLVPVAVGMFGIYTQLAHAFQG